MLGIKVLVHVAITLPEIREFSTSTSTIPTAGVQFLQRTEVQALVRFSTWIMGHGIGSTDNGQMCGEFLLRCLVSKWNCSLSVELNSVPIASIYGNFFTFLRLYVALFTNPARKLVPNRAEFVNSERNDTPKNPPLLHRERNLRARDNTSFSSIRSKGFPLGTD
jgi:hypothetical protein